jgi:hypothetical protein
MLEVKEVLTGNISVKESLTGELTFGTINVDPSLTDLEVTPSEEVQTFNHEDSYGYDNVIVNAVTNEIDSNIQPNNIKDGVTILGVTGTLQEGSSASVEGSTLVFSSGSVEEGELRL